MKYYISGKLTNGSTEDIIKNSKPFHEAEAYLKDRKGTTMVFNPANWEEDTPKPWEWYLAEDLLLIVTERPIMYMLKNWEQSLGARLELEMAKRLSLTIEYESI